MAWDPWLYFLSEGSHTQDFYALKNPATPAGIEPANLGSRGEYDNHWTTGVDRRAVRRRMIYGLDGIWWSYDNRERMWPRCPDICLSVEGKPRKNLNQEICPTGDWTRARCVRSNDVTPRLQRGRSEICGTVKLQNFWILFLQISLDLFLWNTSWMPVLRYGESVFTKENQSIVFFFRCTCITL